jgi:protein-L-isoaspartate(D-aspartate) O-methyltransferase
MKVFDKKIESMISRLRESGITDERVLRTMSEVPRHFFLPDALQFQAYDEKALPIGFGQTISHPYTVARMTELLNVQTGDKVLEIGTGSGYQAAVLCALGAHVYNIEIVRALAERAARSLARLKFRIVIHIGDGSKGWSRFAPYNMIIVTAGAPALPEILLQQLSEDNGKLVIPIGKSDQQTLTVYHKRHHQVEIEKLHDLKFVPLRGKFGWKQ